MKRALISIGISLGIMLILGVGGLAWMAQSFKRSLEPRVALDQYAKIVAERAKGSELYSFLPKDIDSTAERSAFYHLPGFLQGSDVICLRQKLPMSAVESLLQKLEHSGRQEALNFGEGYSPRCFPEYGNVKPSSKNLFEGLNVLPKGFRIFLFNSDLEDIKKNWNHNFLAFTAVSIEDREVVYYVESW